MIYRHEEKIPFPLSYFMAQSCTYRRKKVFIKTFLLLCVVTISMLACFRGYKRSNGLKFPVNILSQWRISFPGR